MHSRRFFLQGTAATFLYGNALPILAVDRQYRVLKLSSDRMCTDVCAFENSKPSTNRLTDTAQIPPTDISSLVSYLSKESIDIVYGLGTASDEFLVEQIIGELAAIFPAKKVLSGRHRYMRGVCHHQLGGEQQLVDSLAAGLPTAGEKWPKLINTAIIAQAEQICINRTTSRISQKSCQSECRASANNPRLLHSWVFARANLA